MSTRKLYQFPQSGNSRTVRLILAEKGLEFERVNINFAKGEHKSPEFLALNPKGKVPVLVEVNGEVFVESNDINEHLEKTYPEPSCLPAGEAEKARSRERAVYFEEKAATAFGPIILEILLKPPPARNMDLIARKKEECVGVMRQMEEWLTQDEWLSVDRFGLADACFVPTFAAFGDLDMSIPEDCPKVAAWFEKVKERPSFEASAK